MITVRPSVRTDLAAVDALLARSYPRLLKPDYPPSVLVTALPIISRAQPELLSCGTYYVAEDEGEIRGAGGWTQDRTEFGAAHVRHVVTDDRYQRRGLGRAIIAQTLEAARGCGISRLECWSTRTAERFYHAMGFETLGPMEVQLAPGIGFPAVRMRQVL
jgi:GNAT superfamily N-acetyltransferase